MRIGKRRLSELTERLADVDKAQAGVEAAQQALVGHQARLASLARRDPEVARILSEFEARVGVALSFIEPAADARPGELVQALLAADETIGDWADELTEALQRDDDVPDVTSVPPAGCLDVGRSAGVHSTPSRRRDP